MLTVIFFIILLTLLENLTASSGREDFFWSHNVILLDVFDRKATFPGIRTLVLVVMSPHSAPKHILPLACLQRQGVR